MRSAENRSPTAVSLASAMAIDDAEALLALARSAGMLVTLDGQIDARSTREWPVCCAFQRFAVALRDALTTDKAC
jgi:hypothetical protein